MNNANGLLGGWTMVEALGDEGAGLPAIGRREFLAAVVAAPGRLLFR